MTTARRWDAHQDEALRATFICPRMHGCWVVGSNRRVEQCDECDGKGVLNNKGTEDQNPVNPSQRDPAHGNGM